MDSDQRLCESCAKIPFDPGLAQFTDGEYPDDAWELGTFRQIRSRQCPFCRLVAMTCSRRGENSGSWEATVLPGDDEVIRVRWFGYGFELHEHSVSGNLICLAGDVEAGHELCVREDLGPWIDWTEIRRWLSQCRSGHEDCAGPDKSSLNFAQHRFRLIDVQANCIVHAEEPVEYMALSYVWGNSDDGRLLLKKALLEDLLRPGSLHESQPIPATIRDAMTVTRGLEQRYLWVDSLCLVQDDPEELGTCVVLMDRIYQEAVVTIVAADGVDAHAGLPGVVPTPRKGQRAVEEIVPGLHMAAIQDLDFWLRPSRYSQRGWTMQEEVLSRRKLLFINGQIYFRCLEMGSFGTLSEEFNHPGRKLVGYNKGYSLYSLLLLGEEGISDFISLMLYYTHRVLSFDGDILRASLGMLHRYVKINNTSLIEGLPCPLDQSLLFSRLKTRPLSLQPGIFRREGFPSYSWTGWRSSVHWEVDKKTDKFLPDTQVSRGTSSSLPPLRTWIRWYLVDKFAFHSVSPEGELRSVERWQSDEYLEHCRQDFKTYKKIQEDDGARWHEMPYPVLMFWTVCVNLTIVQVETEVSTSINAHYYNARNGDDEYCGSVVLDTDHFEGKQDGMFAIIAGDSTTEFWALLLKRGPVAGMERWGLGTLTGTCLEAKSSAPQWRKIYLG